MIGRFSKSISKGIPPYLLYFGFFLLTVFPFLVIAFGGLPLRSFPDEFATQLGIFAYTWILLSFLLSGRFRSISGKIGIDKTIRFHQFMAIVFGLIIFLHPYFYTLSFSPPLPWDNTRELSLLLTAAGFISGMLAWILIMTMILMAIFRDQLAFSYETWRILHGVMALIVAVGATLHVLEIGRYTQAFVVLKYFWLVLLILASLTLIRSYIILPFLQKHRPFRVTNIQPAALKTWHLIIESQSPWEFHFTAGQFAWIKLKKSPFGIHENPFSISSAPSELPNIRFTIKEIGDSTSNIGKVQKGDTVYIDGPHGHFIIGERNFAGILMIAGGIGVSPMISIIKEQQYHIDQTPIKLLYGNRIKEQIAFRQELDEAAKTIPLETIFVLSEPDEKWQGETGFLDDRIIQQTLANIQNPGKWLYLLCGPPSMLNTVIKTLKANGISNDQIEYEKFAYFN